jgi:hypothetical protein
MPLHNFFEWDGFVFTTANPLQRALREIQILKILQMLEDGFADVEALGAPGTARKLFQSFFDRFG